MTAAARADQLLDVAERLFIEQGFDRTSVGDIAAAAGVTRPIVYEHHGSKEGVYLALLERAKRRIREGYAATITDLDSPRDVLRSTADVFFAMVEDDPARWVLLYGGRVPLAGEHAARQAELAAGNASLYLDTVAAWARDDLPPERVAQVVTMLWGAAGLLAQWWLLNRHVGRDEVVEVYTEAAWHALAPILREDLRG